MSPLKECIHSTLRPRVKGVPRNGNEKPIKANERTFVCTDNATAATTTNNNNPMARIDDVESAGAGGHDSPRWSRTRPGLKSVEATELNKWMDGDVVEEKCSRRRCDKTVAHPFIAGRLDGTESSRSSGWLGGWMDDVPFEDTHFWPERAFQSHLLCMLLL